MSASKKALYTIMFVLPIALTGIADLATAGFDAERLIQSSFWFNLGIVTLSNFLVLIGAALMTIDNMIYMPDEKLEKEVDDDSKFKRFRKPKNYKCAKIIAQYEEEIKKTLDESSDTDIDDWLNEVNLERKKVAWRKKINRKLLKAWFKWRKNKFRRLLDETYINNNIEYLKIKYKRLSKGMIQTGYYNNSDNEDIDIGKGAWKMVRDITPRFALSISFSILLASFTFDLQEEIALATIIRIIVKLVTLAINFFNGLNYGPQYVKSKIIGDLLKRLEWLKKYLKWKITKKPFPVPVYQPLPTLELELNKN